MARNTGLPVLVRRTLDDIDAFQARRRSVFDLARDLLGTARATEADVPLALRDAIMDAASDLEVEWFTSVGQECIDRAEPIVQSVEDALRSHYGTPK